MAKVLATVRKTVDYAKAYPETFRPGTPSYGFFEKMTGICATGLEHFTTRGQAWPLLDILEMFAETERPEAKAYYAAWLSKREKGWYNPLIAKIMLMHAIDDVTDDNPQAPYVMLLYALHVLEGKAWFHRDEALARRWLVRSAALGCAEAKTLLKAMDSRRARQA